MHKNVSTVVFWGSLWGCTEATLGYVLHLLPINIGWFFWFPLALFFMSRVYKSTKKFEAILYTAFLASAIKLTNLLLPVRIDKVLNPAVSILLEGLVVFAAYKLIQKSTAVRKHKLMVPISVSTAWRLLYLLYITMTPNWMVKISPLSGLSQCMNFLLFQNAINALTIFVFLKYFHQLKTLFNFKRIQEHEEFQKMRNLLNPSVLKLFKPLFPFLLLGITLLIQWSL